MSSGTLEDVVKFLKEHDNYLLGCHMHPDGDAIGSLLALGLALSEAGKKVQMVLPDGVPMIFKFLEGADQIRAEVHQQPEVVVSLDCAELSRLLLPQEVMTEKVLKVNIDHHVSNAGFGDLNLIFPEVAATGQIVYDIIRSGGFPFDQRMAAAIYTAVATDTGFFRFSNTSGKVLALAAELVREFGISPAYIAEHVHEEKSFHSVRLLGEVLSTLQLTGNKKVSWMVMDQAMLTRYPVELEETENFVNYAGSIQGVMVGLLFKEIKRGEVKISWRSREPVDVSVMAAEFGGGGHARAAGCTLFGTLADAISKVLTYLDEYFQKQGQA